MVKEKSTDFRDEQNTNERRDDFASLCFSIILHNRTPIYLWYTFKYIFFGNIHKKNTTRTLFSKFQVGKINKTKKSLRCCYTQTHIYRKMVFLFNLIFCQRVPNNIEMIFINSKYIQFYTSLLLCVRSFLPIRLFFIIFHRTSSSS